MNNPINSTVFNTRDLQVYIEYLGENLVYAWNDYIKEVDDPPKDATNVSDVDFDLEGFFDRWGSEIEEYEEIIKFAETIQQYTGSDYHRGAEVIHEDYWEEYCELYCKSAGLIPDDIPSWIVIDWYVTSQNVAVDYAYIDYDDNYYYVRIS